MVTQYIAMWSLLDLCKESERDTGELVGVRWWEHEGIDLAGAWEAAAAVE